MTYRTLIATGLAATAGLGLAGSAMAAPAVTTVEVTRVNSHKAEVDVTTLRGTSAIAPRITVTVGRRSARAKVTDWDAALAPTEDVHSTARLRRARLTVGSTVTVRVRACDTTCATTNHSVTVTDDPTTGPEDTRPGGTLPVGAVTSSEAEAIAITAVGAGSTVLETERSNRGAVWEVKVKRAGDGAVFEVKIAGNGVVVKVEPAS